MDKLERISIELPFILNVSNREYEIRTDVDKPLSFHVANGSRKLIRWQEQGGDLVRLVNFAADDNEVEQWKQRLGHKDSVSVVRANTTLSVISVLEETISCQDWITRKFPERKLELVLEALNRLLDAYRWAGWRKGSTLSIDEKLKLTTVHRIGLVHVVEFVVELFSNFPAPNNYLRQLSIFPERTKDKIIASVSLLDTGFEKSMEELVHREIPETVRLMLDSLSSLSMDNPLQAAFLYWAWVDVELNRAYQRAYKKDQFSTFPYKVDKICEFGTQAHGNAELTITCKKIKNAHSKHRNPMVHGTFIPTGQEAHDDFWLCCEFVDRMVKLG